MSSGAAITACLHCGTAVSGGEEYCCSGCRLVAALLRREGLGRYYDLRGARGLPVADAKPERADKKWLELLGADLAAATAPRRLSLDVQGIHCAACVWLIDELFKRTEGGVEMIVNPALGKLDLLVQPTFPLIAFAEHVDAFGYRVGPPLKLAPRAADSGLLWRMGLCIALAMNSMIFAIAIYAGLRAGPIHRAFLDINFAISALSVAIGGSVFVKSAWQGLRRRILHLDLPIAIGILLAFASSTAAFASGRGDAAYFDTINIFIALMLVGRFLQERVLERNRRLLLASDDADGLLARKVAGGRTAIVPCAELVAGDRLLLAPGDLVPVEARLEDTCAPFSLDWVTGESAPRDLAAGETIPAGAFHVGARAVSAVAAADFSASTLLPLLRTTRSRAADAARATPWWRRFARAYVAAVLVAAAGALALWLISARDPGRALEVTAAVLIVTCPCAFGIATPLAYELAQAGLRRAGLFVRSAGFLDRAQDVRRVVFDKTGTLTDGTPRVVDEAPLRALSPEERQALYDLTARSAHPKSVAIKRALEAIAPVSLSPGAEVIEETGRGLRMGRYSLAGDVVFSVDGQPRATLRTAEELRPDAAAELDRLAAAGQEVWILSGDTPERVAAVADTLALPRERALGGYSPDGKAAWLAAHDRGDTLFVGDGLNDGLVVDRATCSGTPAIDRPFMPARSDFYFVTPGLRPVRLALAAARALARTTRRNLAFALAYNALTVSLAYAGLMSPLLCAVVMPASSLTVVVHTVFALGPRSRPWRS